MAYETISIQGGQFDDADLFDVEIVPTSDDTFMLPETGASCCSESCCCSMVVV